MLNDGVTCNGIHMKKAKDMYKICNTLPCEWIQTYMELETLWNENIHYCMEEYPSIYGMG